MIVTYGRLGLVSYGGSGLVELRPGMAGEVGRGSARFGQARLGEARQVWPVEFRSVAASCILVR